MHVECMLFVECTSKNYNDSLRHSWNRYVRIQYSPDINMGTYYVKRCRESYNTDNQIDFTTILFD